MATMAVDYVVISQHIKFPAVQEREKKQTHEKTAASNSKDDRSLFQNSLGYTSRLPVARIVGGRSEIHDDAGVLFSSHSKKS